MCVSVCVCLCLCVSLILCVCVCEYLCVSICVLCVCVAVILTLRRRHHDVLLGIDRKYTYYYDVYTSINGEGHLKTKSRDEMKNLLKV